MGAARVALVAMVVTIAACGDDREQALRASDSPQFLRFQDDAAGIAANRRPPTSFDVSSLGVGPGGAEQATVTGAVVISRPGEEQKRMELEFVLFRDPASGWQVWTVKDRASGTSPVPA